MRISTKATIFGTLSLVIGIGTVGCKKSDEDVQTAGYQQGGQQYGTQPAGYGTAPAPGTTAPAPGATAPAPGATAPAPGATPAPTATPPAAAGGAAQAIDPAAAAAVQPIITQLLQSEAPGAKAVGSLLAGNFQANQTLEQPLQLEPNKCYTIVGAGGPGVTELNLQLVLTTPLPNMAPVLAEDKDTGAQAVIGRKPNCYKWALPMGAPAKLVMKVAGGAGLAAAQVYAK